MKRTKSRIFRRGILGTGCLLLAAVFMLSPLVRSNDARAVDSLPYVEEIIATKNIYRILEIVPEAGAGSMGYYVSGYEPCRNWAADLASISGASARAEAVNTMFGNLSSTGILSDGTETPLTSSYHSAGSYYAEQTYWGLGGTTDGWKSLRLDHEESASVHGSFVEAGTGSGAYVENYSYSISAGGGYSQSFAFVTYTSSDLGSDYYYYAPSESEDPALSAWKEIENMADLASLLGQTAYTKDEAGHYSAAGVLGQIELDADTTYYWLDASLLGMPNALFSPVNCYAISKAVGWAQDDSGNFRRDLSGYSYVGAGRGDYTFTSDAADSEKTIFYQDIYYQGGYTNNQQGYTGIFNMTMPDDASKLQIQVNSVTPDIVTAAMISSADLVILSAGFDPSGAAVSTYANSGNDLTSTLAYSLAARFSQLLPVIVDYRVAGAIENTNLRKLAQFALSGAQLNGAINWDAVSNTGWNTIAAASDVNGDHNFVYHNIYCYAPDADASAFATGVFLTAFSSAKTDGGFSDAMNEIQSENFYREVAGLSSGDMLDSYVCMATATRYIINYAGQRETGSIESVRVLDIEPVGVKSGGLTQSTVLGWLGGSSSGLSTSDIQINTMAAGEFIGKIEDINENYDLVYIGSNITGMYTTSGVTDYNDNGMDGLIYSHVGDLYRSGINLTGLLDRDYTDDTYSVVYTGSDTEANLFRFSGNDITASKTNALVQFAAAGYPVVIANDLLVSGKTSVNASRVDNSSYMYSALNQIRSRSNVLRVESVTSGILLHYLEVSKPQIHMTNQPVVYIDSDPNARLTPEADGNYYLTYTFDIVNATEPTPQATSYDLRLYIDLNADGRFASEERLSDIEVSDAGGRAILPSGTAGSEVYHLSAGLSYQVRRQMPASYAGIIPWKLEVVKNGALQVHASASNYARIAVSAANKQNLTILQIADSNTGTTLINLQEQLSSGTVWYKNSSGATVSAPYKGIYGALIGQLSDFNVRIITVEADNLESMTGLYYYNNSVRTSYAKPAVVNTDAIYQYLDNFNMLIMGFADMYGEIGSRSAPAITQYIESGKSVLFTHDTTSFSNLPYSGFPTSTTRNVLTDIPLGTWSTNSATVTPTNATTAPTAGFGSLRTGGSVWQNPYLQSEYRVKVNKTWHWYYYKYTLSLTVSGYQDGSNVRIGIDGTSYSAPVTGNGTVTISNITIPYDGNYHVYIEGANGTLTVSGISLTRYDNDGSASSVSLSTSSWYASNNASSSGNVIYFYKYVATYGYIYQSLSLSPGTYVLAGTVSGLTNANSISLGATDNSYFDNYRYISGTGDVSVTFTLSSTRNVMVYVDGYGGTVAFSNITLTKQPSAGSDGTVSGGWWGYSFNTVIRDAVGLDRYGITNSLLRPYLKAGSGDSLLSDSLSSPLLAELNQHDIGYAPKTAQASTAEEVQGFTNYELIRYGDSSYKKYTNNTYSTRETTAVSQVNKGQITTYPYNINTKAFGGTDNSLFSSAITPYMKVGNTHEQYYQVNMANDDIVVWYCLSSGGGSSYYYNDVPNDVTNAYYIYSRGNVTYSGVGHTDEQYHYTSDSSSDVVSIEYVNEAKLFVNTMIAAFQSGMQSPSLSIRDSSSASSTDLMLKYFTMEYGIDGTLLESSLGSTESNESRAVYFKISDPNLTTESKTISLAYYYSSANGEDVAGIPIPVQPFIPGDAPSSPRSGVTYRIVLPEANAADSPLAALADEDTASVTVYIKVTTTINGRSYSDSNSVDSIELRKIGLFELN
ncbi:MAG: DUF5057 domain-containing protein [Clostridiaceae bacterium]|nr:DUF5057 domain-containing protein [Clostridiaceae bacterium]